MAGGALIHWASLAGEIVVPVLGALKAWQLTFMAVAMPGVLLSIVILLTVKEPLRQGRSADALTADHASLGEILAHLRSRRLAYTGLLLGFSLNVLVGSGAASWTPALLSRHFHLTLMEIGNSYGLTILSCGMVGSLVGGAAASQLLRRGVVQANALVSFAGFAGALLLGLGFPFAHTPLGIWTCIVGMNLFSAAAIGSGFVLVNEWAPNRMRAQVGALFLLFLNVIGTGLGPLVVASLSDHLFQGSFALAQAIGLTALTTGVPAIALLWLTVRHYPSLPSEQQSLTSDAA
jgi:MFS family permease